MQKFRATILCIFSVLFLFAACHNGEDKTNISSVSETTNTKTSESVVSIESNKDAETLYDIQIRAPIALGTSDEIVLKSGEKGYLALEMLEGIYENQENVSAYSRNWTGKFRISLYSDPFFHDLLCTVPLQSIGYNKYFTIKTDDYNSDGNPDFAIAVGAEASQGLFYRIFSVHGVDKIVELHFEDEDEAEGLFVMANRSESIRFLHADNQITLYYYTTGEGETLSSNTYEWDGEMFALILHSLTENIDNKREYFETKKAMLIDN